MPKAVDRGLGGSIVRANPCRRFRRNERDEKKRPKHGLVKWWKLGGAANVWDSDQL